MRLICPNCDAQYEVEATLIPAEGRDVQCSACGHVWFQGPSAGEEEEDAADRAALLPEFAPVSGPASETTPDTAAAEPDHDPQVLRRHSLDESLLSVLREEAERETLARAEEDARRAGRGIEIQPELGLPEAEPAPRLRIRPRASPPPPEPEEEPAPPPAATARGARRELLPDIEHINSTLDASNATRAGGDRLPEPPERRRSGFRSGFLLVLVLAALGWGVYDQAPRLSQSLPQAEPALSAYVALVDRARLGLDGLMQGLLANLRG